MNADDPGVTGLKPREPLMEMREDIKGLKATVDVIAKDQALGVGRTGRGDIAGKERKSGRGERRQTSTTDLNVPARLPLEIALTGVERWTDGAIT